MSTSSVRLARVGQTPVAIFEIKVQGTGVVTRVGVDGGEMLSTTREFATAAEAQKHVTAKLAQKRAEGYVEVGRDAPVEAEATVERYQEFEWHDRDEVKARVISQTGRVLRITGLDGPIEENWPSTREASASYDGWIARAHRDIALANIRTAKLEQQTAVRARQLARTSLPRNDNPALEAQCRASPDDPGPWQVYADWLLECGDPIGEVAARALGGDVDGAVIAAFDQFAELHGEDEQTIRFQLRHGFVHHLTISVHGVDDRTVLPDLVRRLLVLPVCRFVDSLQLGLASTESYANDWSATLSVITDAPQATQLRVLRLDAYESTDCEISWVHYGNLAFAWPKLPALEDLRIRAGGGGTLGTLDLPRLRTFVRESGGLRREDVEAICAADRLALEHLELWTGTVHYEGEIGIPDLAPIFDGDKFPALRHLGIVNSELSDELIPALATSKVLPRLDSLDLSRGIFAREATTALVAHADRFRHLAAIDLSANVLFDDEIAELRAVLDNVITNDQRVDAREEDFEDDPGERYVALGE